VALRLGIVAGAEAMVRDADHEVTVVALHCGWRRFSHFRALGPFLFVVSTNSGPGLA
jgi:hypothetical protein